MNVITPKLDLDEILENMKCIQRKFDHAHIKHMFVNPIIRRNRRCLTEELQYKNKLFKEESSSWFFFWSKKRFHAFMFI